MLLVQSSDFREKMSMRLTMTQDGTILLYIDR